MGTLKCCLHVLSFKEDEVSGRSFYHAVYSYQIQLSVLLATAVPELTVSFMSLYRQGLVSIDPKIKCC